MCVFLFIQKQLNVFKFLKLDKGRILWERFYLNYTEFHRHASQRACKGLAISQSNSSLGKNLPLDHQSIGVKSLSRDVVGSCFL